jgi:hypothetical protein
VQRERNPTMVALEEKYELGALELSTSEGITWDSRMRSSHQYFAEYSYDWVENQAMLSDTRWCASKWSNYVMMAYAILKNLTADTYYRNPDPWIQAKNGDRDASRIITDIMRSIHRDVDSESKIKNALDDQGWAGFGMGIVSFHQKAWEREDKTLVPEEQSVLLKTLSPWECRFDPRGREWDMSDHLYFAHLYFPTLTALITDPAWNDNDRRRIMAWYRAAFAGDTIGFNYSGDLYSYQRIDYPSMTDVVEDDPYFVQVPCWMIWDRTKKQVVTQPYAALFTLTPKPWPQAFADADLFPVRYIARNREARNKRGEKGFIGIPDIRLIWTHLAAINRLESQFLAANQNAIFKYLTIKGLLDDATKAKLENDDQKGLLELDPEALTSMPLQMQEKFSLSDVIALIPQPDLKEMRHLEGISHELNMIAQIIGQSATERGGLPPTKTATEFRGVEQKLNARLSVMRHEAGKHYNAITKLMFLALKGGQTLPIKYQATTETWKESVWAEVDPDAIRDLDLHFDYATGSAEERTREEEFALRERMYSILAPMFQNAGDTRIVKMMAKDWMESLNIHHLDQYFDDDIKALTQELLAIQYSIAQGKLNPAMPEVAHRQMEIISMLMGKILNPTEMKAVVQQVQGGGTQSAGGRGSGESGGGMASPAKPMTPGQRTFDNAARGSAAAGAEGGMAAHA